MDCITFNHLKLIFSKKKYGIHVIKKLLNIINPVLDIYIHLKNKRLLSIIFYIIFLLISFFGLLVVLVNVV